MDFLLAAFSHWWVWVIAIFALFTMPWLFVVVLGLTVLFIVGEFAWSGLANLWDWGWHLTHDFSTALGGVPMEAFFGALAGSFIFWSVAFIAMLFMLAKEHEVWTAGVALGLVAVAFFGMPSLTLATLGWTALAYFAIGFAFTFVKWIVYSRKAGRQFRDHVRSRNATTDNDKKEAASRWYHGDEHGMLTVNWLIEEQRWDTTYDKPKLVGYGASWMSFWPLYLALIVLEDLLIEFWNWIVETFGGVYRRITNAAFNIAG